MQKIILFIEPYDDAFITPAKIGDMFMNRFAIDENAASEILNIFELAKTSVKMSLPADQNYKDFTEERQQKGMDHFCSVKLFTSNVFILTVALILGTSVPKESKMAITKEMHVIAQK